MGNPMPKGMMTVMKGRHLYQMFSHWEDRQSIWVISDTHFNDPDSRHFRGDSYPGDDEFVRMINSCLGKDTVLLHLGDVGDTAYVKKLRGYKVLVMGNHDKGRTNYLRAKWDRTIPWKSISKKSPNWYCCMARRRFPHDQEKQEEWLESKYSKLRDKAISMLRSDPDFIGLSELNFDFHSPFVYWVAHYDNRLFDEVYEGPIMLNPRLEASHEDEDLSTQPHKFNIHGHRHELSHDYGDRQHLNMCAEALGYKPYCLSSHLRDGLLKDIPDIHRVTVGHAVERKARRQKSHV